MSRYIEVSLEIILLCILTPGAWRQRLVNLMKTTSASKYNLIKICRQVWTITSVFIFGNMFIILYECLYSEISRLHTPIRMMHETCQNKYDQNSQESYHITQNVTQSICLHKELIQLHSKPITFHFTSTIK